MTDFYDFSLFESLHSKQYMFLRSNYSVLLPCNPRKNLQVLLGLHGNSTEGFFL